VKGVEDRIGSRLAAFGRPTPTDPALTSTPAAASDTQSAPATTVVAKASESVVEETPADVEGAPGSEQLDGGGAAPAPETYRVTAGDNFTVIARRYGVPLNALLEANPQLSPRRLKVGTVVSIPARPPHR
jgi:LysM repeat protein